MGPYYEYLIEHLGFPKDAQLLKSLKEANAAELKRLEEKLVDAQENLGETEVSELLTEKALYYAKIGDFVR